MDNPTVDKLVAMSSITKLERALGELRTRIAGMDAVDVTQFNDFERIIISQAINTQSIRDITEFNITGSIRSMHEAKKWHQAEEDSP